MIRDQMKSGSGMAGILNMGDDNQTNLRKSQQNSNRRNQHRGDMNDDIYSLERSRSAKRKDQMNELLTWEDEDKVKE